MISGKGTQSLDGRTVELKPGMTICIPSGGQTQPSQHRHRADQVPHLIFLRRSADYISRTESAEVSGLERVCLWIGVRGGG